MPSGDGSTASDDLTVTEAFSILSLPLTSTTAEIRKSYRTLSLRLHPDKARDVAPEIASARFDRLQKAYEKLSDPAVRDALVLQAQQEAKRQEKVQQFESQRKKMSEDLLQRERQEEERKRVQKQRERARADEIELLKEQARKMREEAQRVRADNMAASASSSQPVPPSQPSPSLKPMDTTVRLLYPQSAQEELNASDLKALLEEVFGPLVHFKQTQPQSGAEDQGKKRKRSRAEITCLATFEHIESALRCVEHAGEFHLSEAVAAAQLPSSSSIPSYKALDGVFVEWAAAKEAKKAKCARGKAGVDDGPELTQQSPEGCKVGEPDKVTYWRGHDPERVRKILAPTARHTEARRPSPPPHPPPAAASSTTFEADVLQRAMAASRARKGAKSAAD